LQLAHIICPGKPSPVGYSHSGHSGSRHSENSTHASMVPSHIH